MTKRIPIHPRSVGAIILPAGEWVPVVRDGKRTAKMGCPRCGVVAYLDSHEIAEDGKVYPSVECPKLGCFHGSVQLVGWSE